MANELEKTKARDLISESAHDFVTCKITLPLGNKALKKVHTNQFLWTELPKEFQLRNWETIAEALQGRETRYQGSEKSGYTVNRWYIESVDINVDASGKAEMQLGLNAFPSANKEYTDGYQAMQKAYTDAFNKQNNTNSGKTSSGKQTTNAVKSDDTALIKDNYVKKYNIPSAVVNAVKKACNGKKTDKDKAYAWYQWMDAHVTWVFYNNHQRDANTVLSRGAGNCVDNSRVYRLGCLAMGIKCNYVKGFSCCANGECANHQWNKVYINGKGITVDCGRTCASWGSHWGNCSGGTQETTSSW